MLEFQADPEKIFFLRAYFMYILRNVLKFQDCRRERRIHISIKRKRKEWRSLGMARDSRLEISSRRDPIALRAR